MPRPPARTESLVHAALQFHQQGDPAQAEPLYRQALALAPNDPGILNLLGIALLQQTRFEEAETFLLKAVSFDKRNPELYNSLGSIQQALGKHEQAVAAFRKTVSLNPRHAQAYFNLGNTLLASGKISEAVASYRKVAALDPAFVEAYHNMGYCLLQLGKLDEATACCRSAVELAPDHPMAHYNLGNTLLEQGKTEEAATCFRRTIKLDPQSWLAHNNLGNALQAQQQTSEAIQCFQNAIRLNPSHAEAHNNLGNALQEQGLDDEAIPCFQEAIHLNPDYAEAHYNQARLFQHRGRTAEAILGYRHAIKLKPNHADAHWNLAMTLLMAGNLAEGWEYYEHRPRTGKAAVDNRPFHQPRWSGESLSGKTILVWGEQGIGDEILFAGLLPDLCRLANHVILECHPKLAFLFSRSFPMVEVVPYFQSPHPRLTATGIDFQAPVGSLARWLRPTLESFPAHPGYLTPAPERVAFWKARLAALDNHPKVGISWRSKNITGRRALEYSPLENWEAVLSLPGITFVNLQYDECATELAAARERFGVEIHAFTEVDLLDDLDEAAALTQALDVVISPATSVAFLAAALGVPTLQFGLAFAYWENLGTDRFPWFPSMTLFNRGWDEGWEKTFQQIAEKVAGFIPSSRQMGEEDSSRFHGETG